MAGPAGSSVSITARSAETRNKFVCKLMRVPPRHAHAPAQQVNRASLGRPPKDPASPAASPEFSNLHSASPAKRDRPHMASISDQDPVPARQHAADDGEGRENEKLKTEMAKVRQELLVAQQYLNMTSSVKSQHENAISILKSRLAELDDELEFEKRRGSKWKASAVAVPQLEKEVLKLSLAFKTQKRQFEQTLSDLMEQEQDLRSKLQKRMENEQAIVDSLVDSERKKFEQMWKQCQEMDIRAKLAREEMENLKRSTREEIAHLKTMHAEHEEMIRSMHSQEIDNLQAQISRAQERAAADEASLHSALEQLETMRRQQHEDEVNHASDIKDLDSTHADVIKELHAKHAQILQDVTNNHESQIVRWERDLAERDMRTQFNQNSQLQVSEQLSLTHSREIEDINANHTQQLKDLTLAHTREIEELNIKHAQVLQDLLNKHESQISRRERDLAERDLRSQIVKSSLEHDAEQLTLAHTREIEELLLEHDTRVRALQEEIEKERAGVENFQKERELSTVFFQQAADDAEKLQAEMHSAALNIQETIADRNRYKAEAAAISSSVAELLERVQELEMELEQRKDLEQHLEDVSIHEKDLTVKLQKDIETLNKTHAELIEQLMARSGKEKLEIRAAMAKETDEIKATAEKQCKDVENSCKEISAAMKRESEATKNAYEIEVRRLCSEVARCSERESESRRRESFKDIALRTAQVHLQEILSDSRDLAIALTMALDYQREEERCMALATTLELESVVSSIASIKEDVSKLGEAVCGDLVSQVVVCERLNQDLELKKERETYMQSRLSQMEYSIHTGSVDQDDLQACIDTLTNELRRVMTENSALQSAISSLRQQDEDRAKEYSKIKAAAEKECEVIKNSCKEITGAMKSERKALKKTCDTKDFALQSAKVQLQEILQEFPKIKIVLERECEDIAKSYDEITVAIKKEADEKTKSHAKAVAEREAKRRLEICKRAMNRMLKQLLSQAWNEFVDCIKDLWNNRGIVKRVLARMTHRQMASAFECYAWAVDTIMLQRERIAKTMARWKTPELKNALECWLEYIEICREEQSKAVKEELKKKLLDAEEKAASHVALKTFDTKEISRQSSQVQVQETKKDKKKDAQEMALGSQPQDFGQDDAAYFKTLTVEFTRLTTENEALQSALCSMQEQLAEQKRPTTDDVEHLKQLHAAELELSERSFSRHEKEALEVIDLRNQLHASQIKMDQARRQVEVLHLHLRPMHEELNEFLNLIIMSPERLDHTEAWRAWKNQLSSVRYVAPRTERASIDHSPGVLLKGWNRDNKTPLSPSSLSPSARSFLHPRASGPFLGTGKSLAQSPIVYLSSPSRRSPPELLSPTRVHHEYVKSLQIEAFDLKADNIELKRALQESASSVDASSSLELRRENRRLKNSLEESLLAIDSADSTSGISSGERWHVSRVPDSSPSHLHPPNDVSSVLLDQKSEHLRMSSSRSPPARFNPIAKLSQSPTNTSNTSSFHPLSHDRLTRELEQANKARDELLETIQLQNDEIAHLHFSRRLGLTSDEVMTTPLVLQIPEQVLKHSPCTNHMQSNLEDARAQLEQSLCARDDLLSTVQMQDEEVLRLNAELERLTSVCVRETNLRLEVELKWEHSWKIEMDLREAERSLKRQLEETLHILRKTERDLQEADSRVALAAKEQEYLEAKIRELSQEFERQAGRHNALIDEKDIVILKQGEELKQAAISRQSLVQELEQLREQAKIISRLKEEITRLNVDLAQAEESKAAMLLEMEHLTAIAMQMSQTLKLHEREEEVAALERKHTSKAAAKNLMVLGLSAMLLHVQIQRRFKKLCDRLLTKHLVGTVDRALAEMQRVWLGWHDVVRTHRRLDRICALMSTKLRIGVQRLASAELQLVWSTWRCAVQSLRLINYMCDRTVTRQHIMLEDLALSNVQRVWSSWRQTAATKAAELKTERRKIQRVQLFMKRKLIETIGTPFRIWRTRIEELKTQRVDVWAEQAQNICLIERHLKRVQLRTAQGYLDAWYEYTVDEVQKVASVSRMILLMIERCLLMAFRQWCKHIRKCRLLERHLTRMNAKTARSCLDAWYTSGAEEAQKVASMSRMILRMLARLLSLAFQKWCDGVRRQKWERGDSELLHRCVEAESELQKYKGMLTEAGDRLNLAEKAVEAMLKSCGECAMTLDASKSRNIEQLFNLNSQLINLEEMNKKWITKNARKIQELSSRFEEDLLVKDKEIEVLEQAAIESSRHHAREMAEMEQRFAAEMQVKVHAVDTLSQGVASSSQELGAAIASTTARLLAFEETLRQVVAKKEKLKTLLQASTSLVARLEDELAEKYTRVEELEAEKNALFKRCTHAESEWVRCVQEAADMHQEQVLEKDTCRRVIESAKKCVARMVREQQELQNMVRQDFLRAVRDVEDAMGTQSLKESIPGIVSPAVDSVNMSTSCRLSCFVDHLSGVVTDFAAYKRRLISWMELKVQQIHGLCDETVAVQLMIEAFNKMCNCRLDTLIEKCQQIVAQKLDLEGMLAETNFDLTETKKRVRDLEILIKREEQDCANLEKGMDQVTRRLLETENKLERMVSWNAELQEKVQLCHYAASPVNITDDTTPRHVGVQNVLSRAVKSAFSISSGGLIDLSHSNLSSPYQQETSKHVKAFSAQSDNAEALKQHEKEPLFEKSLPPTSVRSDGTREDVEGPSTDERVVELRNEILNSLEESKNIPSCSESNEAKVLQTPVEEKGNWDLGLGSGLGASGVAGVSGVIALSAGHSLLDLFSPRKPAPTPQAKSERDSEGGLIISSAPKLALTVPKLKLDFLNDEGALDNKTALESIEEVDESSRPASMVMASNLTAASAADSDWMESMQKLENLAASTSASGSYAGSPLAERLAGSPLGIKPGENPRPKSLKGQNWLDL